MAAETTDLEAPFTKKFKFRRLENVKLKKDDVYQCRAWQVDELQKLKSNLNSTKSLLNDKDLQTWHHHTSFVNRAGSVINRVKKEIYPELLTQAWLKFYECLSEFDLVSGVKGSSFLSLHLCEAPGAFISALNHYLSLNHNVKFEWLASTLNPYFEGNSFNSMIDDDRFILPTLDQWCFGVDNTGNIMDVENMKDLIENTKIRRIQLVTGDGSIDCMDEPSEQESRVSHLHWCEAIGALNILQQGGQLVLKMFTFFEHSSICLLYLLAYCFKELNVFKPCTSKEGNSEVYVIAKDYQKTEENLSILHTLQHFIYKENIHMDSLAAFPLENISTSFIDDVINCSKSFKEWQEKAILRNLTLYNLPIDTQAINHLKDAIATRYIERYKLKRIGTKYQLVGTRNLLAARWKLDLGLYNRPTYHSWPRDHLKRLDFIRSELKEFEENLERIGVGRWNVEHVYCWTEMVHQVTGKTYHQMTNSKFCHPQILRIFLEINAIEQSSVAEMLQFNQQSALLNEFLDNCHTLAPGTNLRLKGRPVLSRFAVSCVWTIAQLFKTVEFYSEDAGCIHFVEYNQNDAIIEWLKGLDHKLLGFINITELCRSAFYELIFIYNTKLLLRYSIDAITSRSTENS